MSKHIVSLEELQDRALYFSKYILGLRFNFDIGYIPEYDEFGNSIQLLGRFIHDKESYITEDDQDEVYCEIEINETLSNDVLRLNDTLLHELIHFKLWYMGYDSQDGDKQFEDELKRYHISSNYSNTFDKKTRKWLDKIDKEYMQKYEDMYQEYIKHSKMERKQ